MRYDWKHSHSRSCTHACTATPFKCVGAFHIYVRILTFLCKCIYTCGALLVYKPCFRVLVYVCLCVCACVCLFAPKGFSIDTRKSIHSQTSYIHRTDQTRHIIDIMTDLLFMPNVTWFSVSNNSQTRCIPIFVLVFIRLVKGILIPNWGKQRWQQ